MASQLSVNKLFDLFCLMTISGFQMLKAVNSANRMTKHLPEHQQLVFMKLQFWKTLYSVKKAHAMILRAKI